MNKTMPQNKNSMMDCPICRKSISSESEYAPFCSSRCKTIDLGRWADESYKITRPIENRDLEEGVD